MPQLNHITDPFAGDAAVAYLVILSLNAKRFVLFSFFYGPPLSVPRYFQPGVNGGLSFS